MIEYPPTRSLKPLGLGGVLGAASGALFRNLSSFVLIPLFTLGGAVLLGLAVGLPLAIGAQVLRGLGAEGTGAGLALVLLLLLGILVLVAIPFLILWLNVGAAALLAATASAHLGQGMGLSATFGIGSRRGLTLLGATIVSALVRGLAFLPLAFVAAAGLFFWLAGQSLPREGAWLAWLALPFLLLMLPLVIGLIHLGLRLMFAPQAAVLEPVGAIAALERSWDLTRGRTLRLFGYSLAIGLLVGGLIVLLELGLIALLQPDAFGARMAPGPVWVGGLNDQPLLAALVLILFLLLIGGLVLLAQIAFTVLYFDLRHRVEGFGAAPPPTPEAPSAPVEAIGALPEAAEPSDAEPESPAPAPDTPEPAVSDPGAVAEAPSPEAPAEAEPSAESTGAEAPPATADAPASEVPAGAAEAPEGPEPPAWSSLPVEPPPEKSES